MDTAAARERIYRLEEDRDLLLKAWQALDNLDRNAATECHRITRAPEFARTFERIQEQLTALDEEQSALIASLQSADSGWKGGSVHAFGARLLQRQTWRALTYIGAVLHERVEQRAREMGLSVRQVVEAALVDFLRPRYSDRRDEAPPKECQQCGMVMMRGQRETLQNYHQRQFCGNACRARHFTGGRQQPVTDAEILAAMERHGKAEVAAKALAVSLSTVHRRLRRIREREARKAA